MSRLFGKRRRHVGLPPGSLVPPAEKKVERVRLTVLDFDEEGVREKRLASPEEAFDFRDAPTVSWINVDGLHDINLIEKIGKHFGLHPLVLEDIVNAGQRPKLEDYDDYLYLVLRMLQYDGETHEVVSEQVSIILGKNFVLTFQERPGDVFESVRERIRAGKGRVRSSGADYLAYSLVDAIVDSYYGILEQVGDRVENLEEVVVTRPSARTLQSIQRLRTEMIVLRRSVWPLREVIAGLRRDEGSLISEELGPFLNDVYDHTIQVADGADTLRDMVTGLRDTYLSSVSNRMNEVMKVLTIIATIFIPITFVAGVYGMNFEYMPELKWPGGYFAALGVMALVVLGMLAYFRKRTWI